MTEQPLVSVIINCYNGEKYLREAINSVLAQTYKNWELVFWDNQSTDSTRKIVESYFDSRIHYFYAPEHTPLGQARNLALKKASGTFVGFLDADDNWLPSLLSEYINAINSNPRVVLVYSNYFCQEGSKRWLAYKSGKTRKVSVEQIVKNYNIAISAAVFRSDILQKEDLCFNEAFSLIEDYDFYIRLGLFGEIVYISEPLMSYRYHDNNLSHSTKWIEEFNYLLKLVEKRSGIYGAVSKYENIISERAQYVEANFLIFNSQKKEAFSIIKKNIIRHPHFVVLFFKMLLGPHFINKVHILKQRV